MMNCKIGIKFWRKGSYNLYLWLFVYMMNVLYMR